MYKRDPEGLSDLSHRRTAHGDGSGAVAPAVTKASARASAKLQQNISEIFEIFNVRDRRAIDVADVSVALRMLGIGLTKEYFRKEVLPRYAGSVRPDNTVPRELFTTIYVDLLGSNACGDDVDMLLGSTDGERSGTLSLKLLQSINSDLVAQGLEDREYSTDQLEGMLAGAFGAEQVTPSTLKQFMQMS